MSEENVEIVRRYLEKGLDTMSPEGLPALVAGFWEPDGDYYPVRGFPEARPCHGREQIADFLVGLHDPWDYRVMVKDARAIGDDRVLVHTHVWAEGGTSGRNRGRGGLLLLLAAAWTIHQGRGSLDREGCASRART